MGDTKDTSAEQPWLDPVFLAQEGPPPWDEGKMTEHEIRDRLNKWFGDERYPGDAARVIGMILDMAPDDRGRTVHALQGFLCIYCGSDDLPCHCQNDE